MISTDDASSSGELSRELREHPWIACKEEQLSHLSIVAVDDLVFVMTHADGLFLSEQREERLQFIRKLLVFLMKIVFRLSFL